MKILYVITQADGGGAQKYVLALAKYFGGEIAAGVESRQLFDEAQKLGLPAYGLKFLKRDINFVWDTLACFELVMLIKKVKPDVIHLNSTKAGFIGSIIKPLINAKVVYTAHGFIFNEPMSAIKKRFYVGLEKSASAYRDFIITVSKADENSALGHRLIEPQKITTIHNGITKYQFLPRDEAREKLGLPLNAFIFGTIANAYKTKGLDVLIQAVGMLEANKKLNCQFAVIGNGPEYKNLALEIKNLGLEKIIRLLGLIPHGQIYLKAFDAYVLPSRKEGFPFALLDAIQAGLPIVSTRVGGIPEALDDAGILVEPGNPAALASTLDTLITDQSLNSWLSQKAFERSKLFTETKMLDETEKVYKKVLSRT